MNLPAVPKYVVPDILYYSAQHIRSHMGFGDVAEFFRSSKPDKCIQHLADVSGIFRFRKKLSV